MQVTLTLELQDANVVILALTKLPYEQVNKVIGSLHGQVMAQLPKAKDNGITGSS